MCRWCVVGLVTTCPSPHVIPLTNPDTEQDLPTINRLYQQATLASQAEWGVRVSIGGYNGPHINCKSIVLLLRHYSTMRPSIGKLWDANGSEIANIADIGAGLGQMIGVITTPQLQSLQLIQ